MCREQHAEEIAQNSFFIAEENCSQDGAPTVKLRKALCQAQKAAAQLIASRPCRQQQEDGN